MAAMWRWRLQRGMRRRSKGNEPVAGVKRIWRKGGNERGESRKRRRRRIGENKPAERQRGGIRRRNGGWRRAKKSSGGGGGEKYVRMIEASNRKAINRESICGNGNENVAIINGWRKRLAAEKQYRRNGVNRKIKRRQKQSAWRIGNVWLMYG